MNAQLYQERPGLLSREEAEQILKPYLDRLAQCIRRAWAGWESILQSDPEHARHITPPGRARIVNDLIVAYAEQEFAGSREVNVEKKHGFLILIIHNRLVLRFKKFDRSLKSSNIQTNQQKLFYAQLDLPGMPPEATKVTAGYRVEVSGDFQDINVTCPIGGRNKWVIPLESPTAERDGQLTLAQARKDSTKRAKVVPTATPKEKAAQ